MDVYISMDGHAMTSSASQSNCKDVSNDLKQHFMTFWNLFTKTSQKFGPELLSSMPTIIYNKLKQLNNLFIFLKKV